jgi:hypothetical protein
MNVPARRRVPLTKRFPWAVISAQRCRDFGTPKYCKSPDFGAAI